MQVKEEIITPNLAKLYLSTNAKNRKLRQDAIKKYAFDMKNGWWDSNGETIKFDEDGHLVDGQHRCHAVIMSGVSVSFLVVKGIPRKSRETVDCGMKRGVGDVLNMSDRTNGRSTAATANILHKLVHGFSLTRQYALSIREVEDMVEKYPLLEDMASLVSCRKVKNMLTPSLMSALLVLFHAKNPMLAEKLLNELNSGEFYEEAMMFNRSSNFLLLREWLIGIRLKKVKINNNTVAATIIRTWNKTRQGEKMNIVRAISMVDKYYEEIL